MAIRYILGIRFVHSARPTLAEGTDPGITIFLRGGWLRGNRTERSSPPISTFNAVCLTFDPQAGHEQVGRRPAIIVSPRRYNARSGLALICPITNQVKGYPFEVSLPSQVEINGVILSDQVRSLDWRARKAARICELPSATVNEVVGKLRTLIDAQ